MAVLLAHPRRRLNLELSNYSGFPHTAGALYKGNGGIVVVFTVVEALQGIHQSLNLCFSRTVLRNVKDEALGCLNSIIARRRCRCRRCHGMEWFSPKDAE